MYTKAQEIVGILYSYADEGRYRKAVIDKHEKEIEQQLHDSESEQVETASGAGGIVDAETGLNNSPFSQRS